MKRTRQFLEQGHVWWVLGWMLGLMMASTVKAQAEPLEEVTLKLKWLHQFQFAGYYAAEKQGYFRDAGLKVKIEERNLHENNIQQVIDGEAEYGVSDSILMLYQAKKAPIIIVAPIFQHSPQALFTLASSGIDSPYELEKKRIAFYQEDTDGFSILAMLSQLNVEPSYNRMTIKKSVSTLLDGIVDAFSGYTTNEAYLFRQHNIPINIIRPVNYGIDLYGDMLFAHVDEYRQHPDRVARMREAVIKGWQYAMDHKAEMIRYIQTHYGVTKSFDHLMFEAEALEDVIERRNIPIGTLDEGRLRFINNLMLKHGLVDNQISLKEGVYRLTKEALKLTQAEKQWMMAHSVVRVGVERNYAPISFVEQQVFKGISAEFLEILSAKTGIRFEVDLPAGSASPTQRVKQGQLDMVAATVETPERREYMNLSMPYVKFPMVIATRVGSPYIANLKQLKGQVITVVKGYAAHAQLAQKYPQLTLKTVDSPKVGLDAVANGDAYGYIGNVAVIGRLIQQGGQTNVQIGGEMPFNANVAFGIRQDWPELLSIVNKALSQISPETYSELTNKWLQVNYQTRYDWTQLAYILAPVLLILVIIILFNGKLRLARQRLEVTNQQLEVLSVTDHLTGVYNRQYLDQILDAEVEKVMRYDARFSIIMMDLDNFKAVNDEHGHLVGDEVLVTCSRLIQSQIRKSDIFGRWGGEEFIVICTGTTLHQACLLSEKIRMAVDEGAFPEHIRQTVSLGVAQYNKGEPVKDCVDRADRHLYKAKQSGKNQVNGGGTFC